MPWQRHNLPPPPYSRYHWPVHYVRQQQHVFPLELYGRATRAQAAPGLAQTCAKIHPRPTQKAIVSAVQLFCSPPNGASHVWRRTPSGTSSGPATSRAATNIYVQLPANWKENIDKALGREQFDVERPSSPTPDAGTNTVMRERNSGTLSNVSTQRLQRGEKALPKVGTDF